MGRPCVEWSGKTVGLFHVLRRDTLAPSGLAKHAKWICKCACGKTVSVFSTTLAQGVTSCGCERNKDLVRRNTKHGLYGTSIYENLMGARKRAVKLLAMPKWANQERIKEIYRGCPKGWHVDHIVPLQGKNVCGLHVENNLQYLSARENASKKNKFDEGMLNAFPT